MPKNLNIFGNTGNTLSESVDADVDGGVVSGESVYERALADLASDHPTRCLKTIYELFPQREQPLFRGQIRDICQRITALVYPVSGSGAAYNRLYSTFDKYGFDGIGDLIRTYDRILGETPKYKAAYAKRVAERGKGTGSGLGVKPAFVGIKEDLYPEMPWNEFTRIISQVGFKLIWETPQKLGAPIGSDPTGFLFMHTTGVLLWCTLQGNIVNSIRVYAQIRYSPKNDPAVIELLASVNSLIIRKDSYRVYRVVTFTRPLNLFNTLSSLSRLVSFVEQYEMTGSDKCPLFIYPDEEEQKPYHDLVRLTRSRIRTMSSDLMKKFNAFL